MFERYSDSAAAFVVLDPNNSAVYKQLYRAAKAKLKLRLKVTIKDKQPVTPKPATVEDEEPNPVSLVDEQPAFPSYTSPAPAAGAQDSSTSYSEQPIFPGSVAEIQRGFEELLIQPPSNPSPASPTSPCCSQSKREIPDLFQLQETPKMSSGSSAEIPVTRSAAAHDKWFSELAGVSQERQNAIRNNIGFPPTTVSIFSVYCNNCEGAIPDEHYHCSTCDDGDFDLCPSCVENGVLCNDDEHWMIKRFIKNGKVINSTTETIAPKPIESQSKTTLVAPEEENVAATRTCNSCIQGNLHCYPVGFLLANISFRTHRGELRYLHVLPGL